MIILIMRKHVKTHSSILHGLLALVDQTGRQRAAGLVPLWDNAAFRQERLCLLLGQRQIDLAVFPQEAARCKRHPHRAGDVPPQFRHLLQIIDIRLGARAGMIAVEVVAHDAVFRALRQRDILRSPPAHHDPQPQAVPGKDVVELLDQPDIAFIELLVAAEILVIQLQTVRLALVKDEQQLVQVRVDRPVIFEQILQQILGLAVVSAAILLIVDDGDVDLRIPVREGFPGLQQHLLHAVM